MNFEVDGWNVFVLWVVFVFVFYVFVRICVVWFVGMFERCGRCVVIEEG